MSNIRRRDVGVILAMFVIALPLELDTGFAGQAAVSAVVWGILFYMLARVSVEERRALMACLVIATAGEVFLSLGWGIYTYRLHNIPPYVPPGHVLLLMLGLMLAGRMSQQVANTILGAASAYAVIAAAAGVDTFAVPLAVALAAVALAMPNHRRLYASTFLLSLALELYGTWLGNWAWAREVPVFALVTTNPPGVASAFYAVLDALVAITCVILARKLNRSSTLLAPAAQSR